ncbi:MAG TPA: DNA polymerase III subunit chi [Gammaproteobacteria bacterium]|nr:DNA polymerase III subunit chi [Gammaproteobacteria bacterium]
MTQVDFYILEGSGSRNRLMFACRLAEKVAGMGHRVFVQAPSEGAARELDDLMWTFHDGAFLPHCMAGADPEAAVHIGHEGEPGEGFHLLINLGTEVPGFFARFERVAELVDDDETRKTQGRERFRFYKDRGYPLKSNPINSRA